MTREEEIEQQALLDEDTYVEHNYYAFKRGVEWADKHPKRYNQDELCDIQLEMMKQRNKRLIEKIYKWIKENIDTYSKVIIGKNSIPTIVLTKDFKNAFTKAIK